MQLFFWVIAEGFLFKFKVDEDLLSYIDSQGNMLSVCLILMFINECSVLQSLLGCIDF